MTIQITTERINDQILCTIDSEDKHVIWWLSLAEAAQLARTLFIQSAMSCDTLDQVPEDFRPNLEEPPTP